MLIKLMVASLIVLVVLFVALLWLVADLLHISLLLPALVTAFFVIAALSVVLFRKLRASGAARGLELGLTAQAKEQAKLVRPDLQAEVQNMQAEFDKAVAALKSAKFGPGGSTALYFLPWYAIIGPPGAGKSTALRSSGLQFPYTSGSGRPAVKGVGGTRNCDWWLTNEAVVLDTAGRWSTQEEDHDEWLSFLGLLKRYRPRKPLNGLIAAISIGDVATAREDEVEALAQRMRERLDEVQTQLRVSIPVYVLFTKCDLIEGFLETFGDLSRSERQQVWGFTIPLARKDRNVGTLFSEQFAALADSLELRSLARMADDRSLERRALIYAFPQQFAALRRNLEKFIQCMFQSSVYQTSPSLRGAYFTSGTQEGRPFNLLLNRLVEAMGVRHRPAATETAVDQKSYFVHDVFMNVIFEDRDIASASDAELKRQRMQRVALTSGLAVVSLCMGLIPGYAWSLNKYQLARIEQAVDGEDATPQAPVDDAHKLARLEPLRERVAILTEYEREGVPVSMRLGMFQEARLVDPLRHYYASLQRRELVQPIVSADLARLGDFGLRYSALPPRQQPSDEEQHTFYDLLKLHLLLSQTTPPAPGEPTPEVAAPWVKDALQARWKNMAGADPALQRAAAANAELYVSSAREFPELAFPRDREIVERARAALGRVDRMERAVNQLVAMAAKDGSDLSLQQMIGPTVAISATKSVRAAFTLQGWKSVVRDAIKPELLENTGELWVLGTADGEAAGNQQTDHELRAVQSAYFTHYIAEWLEYMRGLRTKRVVADSADALDLMQDFTRAYPPLKRLFERVCVEVALPEKASDSGTIGTIRKSVTSRLESLVQGILGGDGGSATEAIVPKSLRQNDQDLLGESDVKHAFDDLCKFAVPPPAPQGAAPLPTALDDYQEQLGFVRNAFQGYVDNPADVAPLQTALQQARVKVRVLIGQQAVGLKPLLEALLLPPITAVSPVPENAGDNELSKVWCNEIISEYQRVIAGRYPFDRNGQDLPLADFSNFYRPKQGKLWNVIEGQFAKRVQLNGDRFTFPGLAGQQTTRLSPSLLDYLGRARDITLSFYPSGATEPSIEFDVRVQPSPSVAMIQFIVGGKVVEYYNGPDQWKTLVWPGETPAAGAAIVVRGANGMHERTQQSGPWGLFRLLEAGTVQSEPGHTFTVAWQLKTHDVTLKVDFQPKRGQSPFFGVPGRSVHPKLLEPVRGAGAIGPKPLLPGQTCN